jgi:predicted SnoaL-like aldol condensation-catalyzing enzyme
MRAAPRDKRWAGDAEVVRRVIEASVAGEVDAALALVAEDYVEHNPLMASGREGLRAFLDALSAREPRPEVEIKRLLVAGDHVVAHLHTVSGPHDRGTAAIDIFRLEDGLVAEHWDVVQAVPADAANANGMF